VTPIRLTTCWPRTCPNRPATTGGAADQDRPGDRGEAAVVSEPDDIAAESVAGQQLAVYGDAAYGAGPLLATLENAGARIMTKVQPPPALGGRFAKDRFAIDLATGTVTCPGHVTVAIRPAKGGGGVAAFGAACTGCPLAGQCTTSPTGRTVTIGAYEQQLARARAAQTDPAWRADYTATRPKVERKIGHLMRRRHGGRRARVRGTTKVGADFSLLAAAVNLARLGVLDSSKESSHQVVSEVLPLCDRTAADLVRAVVADGSASGREPPRVV
jgi:Transposase DDE domain